VKSQTEVYRAKAKQYARLTILTKSLRESRRYRKLAEMYWALALGEKPRERSAFENDRENEPDMTTYPLEFHRRAEQKWVLRAQASSACESTPRAALAGSSQRGQRRSGHSERRDILAQRPWLREIGQWLRAGYDAVDQPVPDRLAALLKELKSRRH
jgi:hypothetical protein